MVKKYTWIYPLIIGVLIQYVLIVNYNDNNINMLFTILSTLIIWIIFGALAFIYIKKYKKKVSKEQIVNFVKDLKEIENDV